MRTVLSFMEALEEMKAGQAVKRDCWGIMQGYRMILPGSKHIYMIVNAHTAPQVQWAPITVEDFSATDWRLVCAEDLMPPVETNVVEEKDTAPTTEEAQQAA
jgi:Protein of unknown function (DUF2829)